MQKGLPHEHEHIRVEREGAIATVVLDRADRRNALTPAMLLALRGIAEVSATSRTSARGYPGRRRAFLGRGGHQSDGRHRPPDGPPAPHRRSGRDADAGAARNPPAYDLRPTGIATGGATCIATACDFRIGTPETRIGYGEVKLGINLMWHALPLAIQTVGLSRAKTMVMTGDLFDAETLLGWGFFEKIVPADELAAAADASRTNMPPCPRSPCR